jgi:hypothetical protein
MQCPGDLIGEVAVLDLPPGPYTVIVDTPEKTSKVPVTIIK